MSKRLEGENVSQVITVNVKLYPDKYQSKLLSTSSTEYIKVINNLVSDMVENRETTKKTSAHVSVPLNSSVKNQAIKDAKSIFNKKVKKSNYKKVPILKKPVIVWNNQNYKFYKGAISVPFIINGKSKRLRIKADLDNSRTNELLMNKLGTLRVTKKSNKWIAQIAVTIPTTKSNGTKVMGIDLGLKVPAVAVTEEGKTKFLGNGRENKYIKRKFRAKRKSLGKAKKLEAIKTLNNKEQRWMTDKDHKTSRQIIEFAKINNVSVIRLEKLANIRNSARKSRKNEKNLHTWSFYRLAKFIEYKAKLAGILVEYVNPKYTSQICPNCSVKNKVRDRNYRCSCGYHTHRDRVGAINIINAPVIDGYSLSA